MIIYAKKIKPVIKNKPKITLKKVFLQYNKSDTKSKGKKKKKK